MYDLSKTSLKIMDFLIKYKISININFEKCGIINDITNIFKEINSSENTELKLVKKSENNVELLLDFFSIAKGL